MTRSELFEVIYKFYPRGWKGYEPGFKDTEEHLRLVEAASRARAGYPAWYAMAGRIGDRYRLQNESLHLLSGGIDPAYSARIFLPRGNTLGFHVSFLGPYYAVNRIGGSDEEPAATEIAQEIESAYPGYVPIPPELGNEVVPDVAPDVMAFGTATVYVCLFSVAWTTSSVP